MDHAEEYRIRFWVRRATMQPQPPRPQLLLVLVCLALVAAQAGAALAQATVDTREIPKIERATVQVSSWGPYNETIASGSGFVLDEDGTVVTCAHVVRHAKMVMLQINGYGQGAKVVGVDLEHDLAIVRVIAETPCFAVTSSTDVLDRSRALFVSGYPAGTTQVTLRPIRKARTLVSGLPTRLIQFSGTIDPGHAGGPVYYGDTGEILGIALGNDPAEDRQRMNLAVPVGYVIDLLYAVRAGRAPLFPVEEDQTGKPYPIPRIALPPAAQLPIPEALPEGQLAIKAGAGKMAVDPRRGRLYVCEEGSNALTIVNTATRRIEKRLAIGSRPLGVALSPSGAALYVAVAGDSLLVVVDPKTLTVKEAFQPGFQPCGVVCVAEDKVCVTATRDLCMNGIYLINPVESTALQVGTLYQYGVLAGRPGQPVVFAGQLQMSPASLLRCDTAAKSPRFEEVGDPVSLGSNLQDVRMSPDGSRVYVSCGAPYHIQVRDATTAALLGKLQLGTYPGHIALSPDGSRVYAAHWTDQIDVFDAKTLQMLGSFKVKGEIMNMETTAEGLLALQFTDCMWLLDPGTTPLQPPAP